MKRISFINFLICFPFLISYSQNCSDLQKKVQILFTNGNYKEALKLSKESVTLCGKEFGYESIGHLYSLNNLAVIYHEMNNYKDAESIYNECLSIADKLFGNFNLNYASILNSLSMLYFKMKLYTKALPLQIRVVEIKKKLNGNENIDYAESINSLAKIYTQIGKYVEAESLFIEVQSLYKKNSIEEDYTYSKLLNDMSVLYSNKGNYCKAISLQNQSLQIQKKLFGENDFRYAVSLRNLAQLYLISGEYLKASDFNKQSLYLIKKAGRNKIDYIFNLNIIADLHSKMGEYSKAENIYLEVLDIRKKALGEVNSDYVTSLSLLAGIYCKMGKYEKAEAQYLYALKILKGIEGKETELYLKVLNNLANLYFDLKDYLRAEDYYNQALIFTKNISGDDNLQYASYLGNLGKVSLQLGNNIRAEQLLLKSHSILKTILGNSDINYVISLNNIANLYLRLKKYGEAEKLLLEALSITTSRFGEKNINNAIILNNLAGLYNELEVFSKAEEMYLKASKLIKEYLGDTHPKYAEGLSNLAYSYELDKKSKRAALEYATALQIIKNNWLSNLSFLSSNQSEIYINANEFIFESILSFLSRYTDELIISELFDFNIFRKNILLNTNVLLDKTVKDLNDSIQSKWNYYKEICSLIYKESLLSFENKKYISELKRQKDSLEKQVIISIPEFKAHLSNNLINWKDIKGKMKSHDVVIDFVHFRYHSKSWTDTTRYGAFILCKEWDKPRYVNLFDEKSLASILNNSIDSKSINNLYSKNDSSSQSNLYNLVWQPFDSLLKGAKKIYISPSGLLNKVSFSVIPTPNGDRLIDRYPIEQITNIRTISEEELFQFDSIKSMILIGGADFDSEPPLSDSLNIKYSVTDTLFTDIRSQRNSKWSYLAGTENEIVSIKKITLPLKINVSVLKGTDASEEAFKKLATYPESPSIIHIATHGFAFSQPNNNRNDEFFRFQNSNTDIFKISEDPLTRVGLVMAGGNHVWTTGVPFPNHEDGILTGREVSDLNLKGCLLATLSACETGLGEIKGSEGIFSLQRAFKMAGVKYIIVSLWKVPDIQTKEFMEQFYLLWLIKKFDIKTAFRQTQFSMSKIYPPYYWGSFTLIE